ncbi:MAG: DUF4126 domain-containing protein [Synechococcales bacterium]|nr:DUF4126 domain-containing protein [Synechococcales bacterium]
MSDIFTPSAFLEVLLAISLSAAVGFRVFVPLLVLSAFSVIGQVDLPSNLDWIENNQALLVFAIASLLEVAGYYVPWLDHAIDVVSTPAAVIAGTVVSASLAPDMDPVAKWTLALAAGGGTAGATKGFMNLLRTASTALSGGLTNPVLATVELGLAIALSVLAITVPIVAGGAVIGLFIFAIAKARQLLKQMRTKQPAADDATVADQ